LIERAISGGNFGQIATAGANVALCNDAGLSGGTTYVYRVRARNLIGDSQYSNAASATTDSGSVGGPAPGENLAKNKTIVASSSYLNSSGVMAKPPAYAVDGDSSSYWRSGGVDANNPIGWLRVDLGAVLPVGRALVRWKGDYYAKSYKLQVANDTVNWSMVYATTFGSGGNQEFIFPQRLARYVRLYMTKNNLGSYRILELEVYSGSGSAAKRSAAAVAPPLLPVEIALERNHPNPFNPVTTISYALPEAMDVTLKVYNLSGRKWQLWSTVFKNLAAIR
jgi:hypothetical protein